MSEEVYTLLVVDDNEMNRDLLSRRVRRQGYAVELAENGIQALEKVESQKIDLVLLDIMMPQMDGYQVLEKLKAHELYRHIPVIMITSVDEIKSVVRCIELGAEDYLPKPFDPVLLKARIGACLEKKALRDQEKLYLQQIEEEKKRSDELLHVILPSRVVEELKATNTVAPRRYDDVAVLFCDIVDFTPYCDAHEPEEVLGNLGLLVERFETLSLAHGLEKINSIGDEFVAAAGLADEPTNSVLNCVKCGLEMIEATKNQATPWQVRVGIHVGPVMAGVVGKRKFLFALFGDTVNTAARMQSHAEAGSVNVTKAAWDKIKELCEGKSRGSMTVKGKGEMEMFRVDGLID